MIYPELRHIHSPDLDPPAMPADPFDCEVKFQTVVGSEGSESTEPFFFSVVTPVHLARSAEPSWGRGRLIIASFEWAAVVQAIATLFAHCARPTWPEVVTQLSLYLYSPADADTAADA